MKISIYELLGLIKDGKAPKRIKYEGVIFYYNDYHDYKCYNGSYYLFSDLFVKHYDITACLTDEVEILDEPKEDKIEKLENSYDLFEPNSGIDTSWTINEQILKNKINELIDEVNKLKVNNEPR